MKSRIIVGALTIALVASNAFWMIAQINLAIASDGWQSEYERAVRNRDFLARVCEASVRDLARESLLVTLRNVGESREVQISEEPSGVYADEVRFEFSSTGIRISFME